MLCDCVWVGARKRLCREGDTPDCPHPTPCQIWSSFVWILGSVLLTASAFSHSMSTELRVVLGSGGILLAALGSGAQSPTQSKFLGGGCPTSANG